MTRALARSFYNAAKRVLPLILAFIMVVGLLPGDLFAHLPARAETTGMIFNSDGMNYGKSVLANPMPDHLKFKLIKDSNGVAVGSQGLAFDGTYIYGYKSGKIHKIHKDTLVVTEITVPNTNVAVQQISYDDAGGVWFTHWQQNTLLYLNIATGEVTDYSAKMGARYSGAIPDGKGNLLLIPDYGRGLAKIDLSAEAPNHTKTVITGSMPSGNENSRTGGGVIADNKLWTVGYRYPANTANYVVDLDDYNITDTTPPDWTKYSNYYWGAVNDGNDGVWYIPYNTSGNPVAKVNTKTGDVDTYPIPTATLIPGATALFNGQTLWGGVFDGRYIYMSPDSSNMMIRVDTKDGSLRAYDDFSAIGGKPGNVLGGIFDGDKIWFAGLNGIFTIEGSGTVSVSKTPNTKIYGASTNVITATAVSELTGDKILNMQWFRVPTADTTSYATAAEFDAKYALGTTLSADKGQINAPADTRGSYNFTLPDSTVTKNAAYWVKVTFESSETYTAVGNITVDNLYTPVTANERGYAPSIPEYFYGAANAHIPIAGTYGIPYDFGSTTAVVAAPTLGFDTFTIAAKSAYTTNWTAKVGTNGTLPLTVTLDGAFVTSGNANSDTNEKYKYTVTYEKNANWRGIDAYYVDTYGDPVIAGGATHDLLSIPVTADSPYNCELFYASGGRFTPPDSAGAQPVGYVVGSSYTGGAYTACNNFGTFDPIIPYAATRIYIIYQTGSVKVNETYLNADGGGELAPPTRTVVTAGDYVKAPREITGFVPVRYVITGAGASNTDYTFNYGTSGLAPDESQYAALTVTIPTTNLTANTAVTWYYKVEAGDSGIPMDEAVLVTKQQIGHRVTIAETLISETTRYTRKGYAYSVTNDGTADGSATHIIPASAPAQWIFDNTQPNSGGGNQKQTFTPNTDVTVRFHYNYDTNGKDIPDKDQLVIEKYRVYGSTATFSPDTEQQHLIDTPYSKIAPEIDNYVAVGWIEGDYSGATGATADATIHHITENGQTVNAAFTPTANNKVVTYIYRAKAEPVTVLWKGTTGSGNTVVLNTVTINGYIGEVVTPLRADFATESYWVKTAAADADFYDITLNAIADRKYEFTFVENKTSSLIKTVGVSTDGVLNFSTQQVVPISSTALEVKALTGFYGYRVTGYTVEDAFGNELDSGTGTSVTIDPSQGDQTVTFTYVSTITTLKIRAVEKDNVANLLFEQEITDLVIGETYAAVAPYIDDTWVLDGTTTQTPQIAEGANTVVFEYEKAAGNLTVVLREVDPDDNNNVIAPIKVISMQVDANQDYHAPNMIVDFYTLAPGQSDTIYIDVGNLPNPLYIDYVKTLADITIVPLDENGTAITGAPTTIVGAARRGDMYIASAYTIPGYTLTESPTKEVYVGADPTVVNFSYKADAHGLVNINHYYMDGLTKVYLSQSVVTLVVDTKLGVSSGVTQGGFTFSKAFVGIDEQPSGDVEITVPSGGATIEFEYTDVRKTVTVTNNQNSDTLTYKVVSGTNLLLAVPYIPGFVPVSYTVDSGTAVAVGESVASVTLPNVRVDTDVAFTYQTVENAVNSKYINITIKGEAGVNLLYSYAMRISKSLLPFTLNDGTEVFDVLGYSIDAGQDHEVTDAGVYTFNYTTLATTVTIKLKKQGTEDPVGAGTFTVAATANSPFTYLAPFVNGYKLTTTSNIGRVDPVAADGSSEIVFEYAQIVSKVTVIYKETDTNGAVIRSVEIVGPTTGGADFAPPTTLPGYYTLQAGSTSVYYNFNGTDALTIEAYYDKELVPVAITATDDAGSADLSDSNGSLVDQRRGEVVSVAAPIIPNYIVVNGSPKLVIADIDASADFRYRSTTTSGVTVEIRVGSVTGALLQQYVIPATLGDTVTVDPATISISGYNYEPTGSVLTAVAGNVLSGVGGKIVVLMNDARVSLTIKTQLGKGTATPYGDVERLVSPFDKTVYAPYISGYILAGYTIDADDEVTTGTIDTVSLTSKAANTVVTFRYIPETDYVASQFVELTIIASDGTDTLTSQTSLIYKGKATEITAPTISGYALDTTIASNYLDHDDTKPENFGKAEVTLDANGSKTFFYRVVINLANVEVRYINSDDGTTVIKTQAVRGFYIGQQFTVTDVVPDAFNAGGRKYQLDASKSYPPVILSAENTVDVFYKDVGAENSGGGGSGGYSTAKLVVKGVEKATGELIFSQTIKCVVDSKETVFAPFIKNYALTAGSSAEQVITIKAGTNTVTFEYDFTGSEEKQGDGGVSDKIKDTLETVKHIKYINGFEDDTVKPDAATTRAEVAAIFFRLIKDPTKNNAINDTFTDVASGAWYAQAVNYLAKLGILKGYEDGTFKPEQQITRAEFAAIASRFDDVQQGIANVFTDLDDGHWAYSYIMSAYAKGWISGYPGDEFKPNNAITRAEVVKIVNKMLGRRLQAVSIPDELRTLYRDLSGNHWAFADMLEASVEHDYVRDANGNESWK
ncbi:MAG: S-layer homology domain-containing protein [Oscillospiraceae bacterium]|jgi:streptogramin lyase|nr:S-layer homology domain-containing protein [Oscillospiraceae bacterium]